MRASKALRSLGDEEATRVDVFLSSSLAFAWIRASKESNLREESVETRAALDGLFIDFDNLPSSSFFFNLSSYDGAAADGEGLRDAPSRFLA